MRRLSDTLSRLQAFKMPVVAGPSASGRLTSLVDFGANPGGLSARLYRPADLPAGAALVVVLHGCTQTADSYDHGSGWSALAERDGFALLYPEQSRRNNMSACFNWFDPGDTRRGGGEAMSIQQMIETVIEQHGIDPRRVYVTGLSAGGAMAMAMLATYPELFAGGAIIAGLPYATARSVPEALDRMRGHGLPDAATLESAVRTASDFTGPWPTLSVWQGEADATVDPANAAAIVTQWRALHALPEAPAVEERIGGATRRAWRDDAGREVIEAWTIPGMGHGTPLDAGPGGCGTAGPYMLDVGLSSTQRLAATWALAAPVGRAAVEARAAPATRATRRPPRAAAPVARRDAAPPPPATDGVTRVIEDALRAAGLMPRR